MTSEVDYEEWQSLEKKWVDEGDKMPNDDAKELIRLRRRFGYSGVKK